MAGIEQYQKVIFDAAEAKRQTATSNRVGTIHKVWRKDGEQKVQVVLGIKEGGGDFLSPYLHTEDHRGASRQEKKYHKGQNVHVSGAAGDYRMATVSPWAENEKHKAPAHADDHHETYQYGKVRRTHGPDHTEHWLAKSSKGGGSGGGGQAGRLGAGLNGGVGSSGGGGASGSWEADSSDDAVVLRRVGNKPNKSEQSGPWDGPDPMAGNPQMRALDWIKGKGDGKPPSLNKDSHVTQFGVEGGEGFVKKEVSEKQIENTVTGKGTTTTAQNDGTIEQKVDQGGGGGGGGGIGSQLGGLAGMISGLVGQAGGMSGANGGGGAGSGAGLPGVNSIGAYLQDLTTAVDISAFALVALQIRDIANSLIQANEFPDIGRQLLTIADQLSSVSVSVPGIVGQITSLSATLATAPTFTGMPEIVAQLTALSTQLNSIAATTAASIAQIEAATSTLNNARDPSATTQQAATGTDSSGGGGSGGGGLGGIIGQLQGMMGSMGGGQGMHSHVLDLMKGIKSSAFNGQHSTTWDQKGVTHTSGTKVSSTAPNIPHNGQTQVSDNLFTTKQVFAQGYRTNCDVRLKSNIELHAPVFDAVMKLRLKTYHSRLVARSDDGVPSIHGDPGTPSLGIPAQELREIFPSLVHGDEVDDFLSVDEGKFGLIAITALQEYVAATEDRIAGLEARLAKLERGEGNG